MKKGKNAGLITAGFLAGVLLGAPTAQAAVEYLQACPSRDAIYVDGKKRTWKHTASTAPPM